MSRSFTFTLEAEQDALEIWEYLADEAGEATADRALARLYDVCQMLGEQPGIGHFREDILDQRFRFWPAGPYLIVYRWETRPIQAISIVHGARDLDAFFSHRPL